MEAPQDKRRQLDDEMSRFEAEILSGPSAPSSVSLNEDSSIEIRPIIGSNTFDQVKQQLKQASSDDVLNLPLGNSIIPPFQTSDHIDKPRPQPPPAPPGPPQLTLPAPTRPPPGPPQLPSSGPQQSGPSHPPSSGIRLPLNGPRHPLPGPGGQCSPSQFGPGPQRFPQSRGTFGHAANRNGPPDQYGPGPNQPGPPDHFGQGPSAQYGPGPYGPGPNRPGPSGPFGQSPNRIGPPGFGPGGPVSNHLGPPGIGPFGPGQNRPGPPGPFGPGPNQPGPPGSGSFCPPMGPRPSAGPFSPHLPNHGFMGPRGRNFSSGMAPPPGFIPPQVNRSTNNGPMMMGPGPHGRPRPPANFLPPPPPPPGYMPQSSSQRMTSGSLIRTGNSPIISKPPTVISSAPMLYSAPSKENDKEEIPNKKTFLVIPSEVVKGSESKRKKKGTEDKKIDNKTQPDISIALEMAERVKQSTITVKHSVHSHTQPQTHTEEKKKERKPKKNLRYAGGQVWEDQNLTEWDTDDFRLFVGDLGNDVTDDLLHRQFCHYASFQKAKVIRDKRTNKSKGYGFISFNDPQDYIRAMKEMNGKYLGSRPIKLRKSTWKDRNLDIVQKKLKEKQQAGLK